MGSRVMRCDYKKVYSCHPINRSGVIEAPWLKIMRQNCRNRVKASGIKRGESYRSAPSNEREEDVSSNEVAEIADHAGI